MTADIEEQAPAMEQGNSNRKSGRKATRKSAAASGAARRGRKPAASRRAASAETGSRNSGSGSRKSTRSRKSGGSAAKSRSASSGSKSGQGVAKRILSRGRRAASDAYGWASEGASRALPLAVRGLPDQRMVQKLVDERPYMLGALGLGIGAMIGLMLPSTLASMSRGSATSKRSGNRSRG